ncbi:MAG: HAD-IC family P-type ATPase [Acetobacteraceae bacterium]
MDKTTKDSPEPPTPPQDTSAGLSEQEAAAQRARFGPNAVAEERPHPLRRFAGKFWAPVPWMLEAAVLLQLVLGERLEAAVIGALLLFNALLGLFQESRAEAALAALRARLALTALVRRDGAWRRLPAADLVPADVVTIGLGAVVPADLRLLSGAVALDQSMLTGESLAVERTAGEIAYAGALIRRGEAVAEVTATGAHTYFGRTAELVRLAHAQSAEQHAVFAVVRNLAVINGGVVVLVVADALTRGMGARQIVPLVLTAILASIPVALPATFTLASALSAQRLVRRGVLPTRLSAIPEAATMDVLCSDKTGTLTANRLAVASLVPFAPWDEAGLLALALVASGEGGADPVDQAIRTRAEAGATPAPLIRERFTPFDPARKLAEGVARTADGTRLLVLKGAYDVIAARATPTPAAEAAAARAIAAGERVLAVAAGPEGAPHLAGLIGLADPPREDSAPLVARLRGLGVRTVMVTGDAAGTAAVVARAVGIEGPVRSGGAIPATARPQDFAVLAGVFPEDKFHLVKAFQAAGHTVGMCGDGANDAPALRQAQLGIAVASATDIAKSAAAMVLTEPGLGGILAAVEEGRRTFQRILTYTLNTVLKKVQIVLLLAFGLALTGQAVLTPLSMVLLLLTQDFLTMSFSADRVAGSPRPDRWRIGALTLAAVVLGLADLGFSLAALAWGRWGLGLAPAPLRSLVFAVLVFTSQVSVYVVRERRAFWASRPGFWLNAAAALNLALAFLLAGGGIAMAALPVSLLVLLLGATAAFGLLLDRIKLLLFRHLRIG